MGFGPQAQLVVTFEDGNLQFFASTRTRRHLALSLFYGSPVFLCFAPLNFLLYFKGGQLDKANAMISFVGDWLVLEMFDTFGMYTSPYE